ncbi:hypothetical protein D3C75_1144740 [compost metagenome]
MLQPLAAFLLSQQTVLPQQLQSGIGALERPLRIPGLQSPHTHIQHSFGCFYPFDYIINIQYFPFSHPVQSRPRMISAHGPLSEFPVQSSIFRSIAQSLPEQGASLRLRKHPG